MRRLPHLVFAPLLAFALLIGLGDAASAHAVVIEATPANNAVLHGSTVEVRLRFNNRIDRARSRLMLLDALGKSRVVAIASSGPPDLLTGEIADVAPGEYRLRWQVLALDGHITHGDVPFTVVKP